MQMRYFAYDNQLQMAAVPCPIWFTDRQDASAKSNVLQRPASQEQINITYMEEPEIYIPY